MPPRGRNGARQLPTRAAFRLCCYDASKGCPSPPLPPAQLSWTVELPGLRSVLDWLAGEFLVIVDAFGKTRITPKADERVGAEFPWFQGLLARRLPAYASGTTFTRTVHSDRRHRPRGRRRPVAARFGKCQASRARNAQADSRALLFDRVRSLRHARSRSLPCGPKSNALWKPCSCPCD